MPFAILHKIEGSTLLGNVIMLQQEFIFGVQNVGAKKSQGDPWQANIV